MAKNWALVIGINQYDFLQPLKYAKRDARLIQDFFRKEAGSEQVFLFSDNLPDSSREPTHPRGANLQRLLHQLFEKPFLEAEDNFWFFFSGHGMMHANHDYLMPSDGDPNDIENTAISINYLIDRLCRCGTGNIILILDACRQQHKKSGEGIGRQTQKIALQTGVVSLLSCRPDECSYEIDALEKGVFTHALLEGLGIQGQCATGKRLNQYLNFRVPELVNHYHNAQQTPYTAEPITKSHLILIQKYANLHDISIQKDILQTEINKHLELTDQLWILPHTTTSNRDINLAEANSSNAQLRLRDSTNQTTYCTSSNVQTLAQHQHNSTPLIAENPIDYLTSERGIEYKPLRDLLAAGEWKQADRETLALMLKVASREKEGWLDIQSINKFPQTDLRTIDQLWVKFSNGRFGFSVQKEIWENVGGQPNADYEIWCKFCDRIGWRMNNNWLFYSDLTFSTKAPLGHFPAAGSVNILTVWGGWVVGLFSCLVGFSALMIRLAKFKLS